MTKGRGKDPGAGGLKKHLNLKAHKERQQPSARRHLGTLEKHRDYAQRAKVYHSRESKLGELRQKAAQRNPEEFDFGMIRGRADPISGKHITDAKIRRDGIQQRTLNNKDIRYLENRRSVLTGEIRELESQLPESSFDKRPGARTIFHYGDEESESAEVPLTSKKSCKAVEHILPRITNGERNAYERLNQCLELKGRIGHAPQSMEVEQNLLSKGRRRMVQLEGGQRIFKWTLQRSR